MNFELESYDIKDLKKCLKPYQIEIVDSLLENFTPEEAIEQYLSAKGPNNIVQFGGNGIVRDSKSFITTFRNEFDKCICGHPDYKDCFPNVKEGTSVPISAAVSCISSALGAKIGVNAALISPVIVIAFSLLAKMGRRAYCTVRGYPIMSNAETK